MLWFFERDGVHISYEVRPSAQDAGFELIIHFPDGHERREAFRTHAALLTRQAQLDRQFVEYGWVQYASLEDDAPDARPTPS